MKSLIAYIFSCFILCAAFVGCSSNGEKESGGVFSGVKSAVSSPFRWGKKNLSGKDSSNNYKSQGSIDNQLKSARRKPRARAKEKDLQQAVNLMVKRRFTDALKIIEPYIQKNPRNAEAFSLKGDCHYQLLEFNKAVECYKIARKLDPAYYPALRGLGFVELNIAKKAFKENDTLKAYNHFEHAITILREANKILPRDMNVVYGRAYAAEGMGRFFYQRSLNLFRMRKDLQGAETMADKAQQFFNESIEMARMYSMHFDRKIEPRALIGDIFVRIALLHQEFGRNAQANQAMRNALITWQSVLHDIDPENVRAKENVAKCSEWLQKYSPKGVNSGKGAEISIGK